MKKKVIKIDGHSALNFITCIGAAIVILGALAKLTHLSFADTMLTVGLVTESIIFIIYAFLPPEKPEVKHHHVHQATHQAREIDTKSFDELNKTLQTIFRLK